MSETPVTATHGVDAPPIPWVENDPSGISALSLPSLLLAQHELTRQLAWRSIKARTQQSFLGLLWPISQPVTSAFLYFLVFNQLAGIESGDVPYPLFAFTGAVLWTYVSSTTIAGTQSITNNTGVVTRTYLPRIVLPAAACVASLFGLAISLGILGVLLAVFTFSPPLSILALPLWIAILVIFMLGQTALLSVLNARSRDVAQGIGYLTQLWQYASPIGYPAEVIPERWRTLYYLNPLAGIIDGFRWAILGTDLHWRMGLSLGVAAAIVVLGFAVFARMEKTVADFL